MPNPVTPSALREHLTVVHRRLGPILVVVVVVCGGMMAVTLTQTPTYQATASVLIQPNLSESLGDNTQLTDLLHEETEVAVMRSRSVTELAARELGHEPEVSIGTVPDTRVVEVTAASSDPATAAADATGYARVYVESRRQGILDDLTEATTILQEQLASTQAALSTAERPLRDLEAQAALAGDAGRRAVLQRQVEDLEAQLSDDLSTLRARRTALQERVDQLSLTNQLTVTGGATLISAATEPSSPVAPQPVRNAALALVAGSVLGLALAFLLEQLDDEVHGRDEVEAATRGLPILGLVPRSKRGNRRPVASPAELQDDPALAEAFRALRTSVQFTALGSRMRSIQVTSAGATDGKTTTVAGLAITLAQAGLRVVVVDADLRRPRIHDVFDVDPAVGVTDVLTGQATLDEALHCVPDQPLLAVVPCGTTSPQPSEMLAMPRFQDLIAALANRHDFVIVDTPPVLPVADARVVAGAVDATLLVVTAERSKVKDVQLATDLLRQVDAPLVGVVFNLVPTTRRRNHYGYGYGSYGTSTTSGLRLPRPLDAMRRRSGDWGNGRTPVPARDEPG
jgi:capsular exopolysaccharide synthesis family protein